jgi:hypothetical protein
MRKPENTPGLSVGQESIQRRERRPVAMQALVASDDGQTGEALLLDLSYDGCGIETPLPLRPGQAITLSVPGRGAIRARVRWCDDGKAGLVFDKDHPDRERQKRAAERVELKIQASMRRIGMGNYRVNVSDLSPDGCKVELVERPRVGEHVMIKFDAIEAISAEVCWVQEYFAGLRFERPIHEAVFELMFARPNERS